MIQKSKFKQLKEHKTKLVIAGTVILAVTIGGVYFLNHTNTTKAIISKLPADSLDSLPPAHSNEVGQETIKKICTVKEHIRNLPAGSHPSPEKIASAAEKGILITKNQTYVTSYKRRYAA